MPRIVISLTQFNPRSGASLTDGSVCLPITMTWVLPWLRVSPDILLKLLNIVIASLREVSLYGSVSVTSSANASVFDVMVSWLRPLKNV